MNKNNIIPEHKEGKQNDLNSSVTLSDIKEAKQVFTMACDRVATPSLWHELVGPASAKFAICDSTGEKIERNVRESDYLQIDIPGPGPASGEGYDWVKVTAIEDKRDKDANEESFAIKVQPCDNPLSKDSTTAHFFKTAASSTFKISRMGNVVTSSYYGRNELPNNNTSHTLDNVRNTIIATGAALGLSEAQWYALISSFIKA